jgi:hypothetical protein
MILKMGKKFNAKGCELLLDPKNLTQNKDYGEKEINFLIDWIC